MFSSILLDLIKKLIVIFVTVMNEFFFKFLLLFKIFNISFKNKFLLLQKAHLGLVHVLFFLNGCLYFVCFLYVILNSSRFFFTSEYLSFFLLQLLLHAFYLNLIFIFKSLIFIINFLTFLLLEKNLFQNLVLAFQLQL